MNKTDSLSGKNAAIQKMMSDGNGVMNFYRFVAQNPHLSLRGACQIIVERSNASVCFSYEEWNAMGRRINKGSKGIPYIDTDGQKRFVYDSNDTHGDGRYKRLIYPMKRLLKGLDDLNGTAISEDLSGDYKKIQSGVTAYLSGQDYFTDDEEYNKLLSEGVSYYLYCKTGFPKNTGINLSGLPYDLKGNADFFMNVKEVADNLQKEVEEAYIDDLNKVETIDDTEEENISDEPVLIILTIFNIILFVLSTIAYFGTKENLKIFNSTGNVFEYEEREKGNVYLALNQRERVALVFDETNVKVSSAYRYDDRPEMVEIIRFIRYYSEVNGFEISRRNSDLWGELRLHTALYKMGYKEVHTLNAEIDYEKDDRW